MRWHALTISIAIVSTSIMSVTAYAQPVMKEDCWYPDELSAAQVQNFQTMLMIGTFKCLEKMPSTLESYKLFMNNKRDFLVHNKNIVISRFIRQYGQSSGNMAYMNYETGVGNLHSMKNIIDRCETIGAYSRLAANASESDLVEFSRTVADNLLAVACPADQGSSVASMAVTQPPMADLRTASTAATTQPTAASNMPAPLNAPAATEPASGPAAVLSPNAEPPVANASFASAPEPVDIADAPATPTAAQALQDAARALALAATALQAKAATPTEVADSN
ncbi:hypothetical protein [Rhizorhapis sp. SPR117]|uniref:hypothetical protein n=1 Tax=Rhizorhapis sp. SPR117 TaxID=2912611 RepID=UPI001F176DDE|nr:hypothetical protein [Rhizorhapis sp. SPR117]